MGTLESDLRYLQNREKYWSENYSKAVMAGRERQILLLEAAERVIDAQTLFISRLPFSLNEGSDEQREMILSQNHFDKLKTSE